MLFEADSGDIRMAITGDSLITQGLSMFREERFVRMVELLRGADMTYTNAETLFHNYEDSPTHIPGGTYMRCDPKFIQDLRWMGIDMVGCAHNHAYDFGENGVLTNIRYLDAAGMPHAGTGHNLAEASSPTYLDTPKGRVALICATFCGPPGLRAADQWRDGKGRPGANVLRYVTQYTVDRASFDAVIRLSDNLGLKKRGVGSRGRKTVVPEGHEMMPEDSDTEFYLPDLQSWEQYPVPVGTRFIVGDSFGTRRIPHRQDIERNLQRIRDAKRQADWVIFSVHDHEGGKTRHDPSSMAIGLAHEVIDAGADVYIGNGPHWHRGIEVYKGKPIFYSLGHLIAQNNTVLRMPLENMLRDNLHKWEATPADFYDARIGNEIDQWRGRYAEPFAWRSAIAMVTFKGKRLEEIKLHCVDTGFKRPRPQRGRPVLADREVAQELLELFKRVSTPYGTNVQIEGDLGVIRVNSQQAS